MDREVLVNASAWRAAQAAQTALEALMNEDRYRYAVELSPQLPWIAAPYGGVIEISPRWLALTGLSRDDALADGWVQAVHSEDRPATVSAWTKASRTGEPYDVEHRIRHIGGDYRWMRSRAHARRSSSREIVAWYGTTEDIHERKLAEAALQSAVASRDLLLREQNHRINNSLMLVAALLKLRLGTMADASARGAIEDSVARIITVAQVHHALQRSADLCRVSIGTMLRGLSAQFDRLNPCVDVRCTMAEDVVIDPERATPLALIVSELLINALKYAYPDAQLGTIHVSGRSEGELFVVAISDQGAGIPTGSAASSGLGTKIVRSFCTQIGAILEVETAPEKGTLVLLRLPLDGRPAPQPEP